MNKVVCNVCGTSYPENADQCPICGFFQSERVGAREHDNAESTYTYVKGGRYSKANVKKRNAASANSNMNSDETLSSAGKQKKSSKSGTVIIAIVLLIAIILAGGYVALRFFIPNDFIYEGIGNIITPEASQNNPEPTESASVDYSEAETTLTTEYNNICNVVIISDTQVTLTASEQTYKLNITLDPVDTTDQLQFISSDPKIAHIDADGVITAKAEGTAAITVKCGEVTAECSVICTFETISTAPVEDGSTSTNTLALNRKEITFDTEGQSWVLYNGGNISVFDIVWSSDNDAVATIVNGKVVAVADGDTTVYGTYGDQVVSCIIHCNFASSGNQGSGGISEASGDSARTYKLHNPYGLSDDVTIHVDEQFPLMLVDESQNKITNAQWSVGNTNCCSYENETVKGLAVGTTEITATYEGTSYTCVVRVIE